MRHVYIDRFVIRMTKQVQLSNHMIHRLDSIRSKYDNCSYSKAIEYLIQEDNNPNRFVVHRLQEINLMIQRHFEFVEEVNDANAAFQHLGAKLVRSIHEHEREHLKPLFEEGEE